MNPNKKKTGIINNKLDDLIGMVVEAAKLEKDVFQPLNPAELQEKTIKLRNLILKCGSKLADFNSSYVFDYINRVTVQNHTEGKVEQFYTVLDRNQVIRMLQLMNLLNKSEKYTLMNIEKI